MKKPPIPDGTPQWLRTMLEILVGRRKNLLPIPRQYLIDFTTPTAEEVTSLYDYVNEVRNSTVAIIDRLDEADLGDFGSSAGGVVGGGGGGGGGGGTVISVAQTVPVEFSVSGSPITNSGTLAISKVTQSAATVWAGPISGAAAVPTFRALAATDIPGGGFVPIAHGRIAADGAIIWSKGISSVAFVADGVYDITTTVTVGTSSGEPKMSVQVTPSGASGSGGSGSSPFKAFDDYEVVATDTTSDPVWQYNATNGKFYLLGPASDDVYIHTDATFTTAPVTVDPDGVAIRVPMLSGCLSNEGAYVWLSGDGYPIRAMRVSDNAIFNFGGTPSQYLVCATDNLNALAGSGVSGPRIWVSDGGDVKAYDPDVAGESLGSVQLTYSSLDPGSDNRPALFDKDGRIWCLQGGALKQVNPILASFVNHTYPTQTPSGETMAGSLGGASRLAYDSIRNVIYAVLTSTDPNSYIWMYSGWTNGLANSGTWEFITKVSGFASIYYESAQDLLFIANYSTGRVLRFAGYPKTLIDIVSVDDTSPDNPDIDYDLQSARICFYKHDSTGSYGYVSGQKGAVNYLIKISYNGDDISLGDGGAVFGNVFLAHGTVISTTVARAEIFRSISPAVRASAQFNVAIFGEV